MIATCLSVRQPWASRIASGEKTIETRTWKTPYRGPLVIAASKIPNHLGPAGVALCIVDLVDCVKMTAEHERAACCTRYPGAYAWMLENVRLITPPQNIVGRQGLYTGNIDVPIYLLYPADRYPCAATAAGSGLNTEN